MFEALLVVENVNDSAIIIVHFAGASDDYGPYSINGMDTTVTYEFPIETNPLLNITLDEVLDPNDRNIEYNFGIVYSAISFTAVYIDSVNVILHEIGKLTTYHIEQIPYSTEFCQSQTMVNFTIGMPRFFMSYVMEKYVTTCHISRHKLCLVSLY